MKPNDFPVFPWEERPKFGARTMLSHGLRSQNLHRIWLISTTLLVPYITYILTFPSIIARFRFLNLPCLEYFFRVQFVLSDRSSPTFFKENINECNLVCLEAEKKKKRLRN